MMPTGTDEEIHRRKLDTQGPEPAVQIAEVVADVSERGPADLSPTYYRFNGILNQLFDLPAESADTVKIEVTYEGYRVVIDQTGTAEFSRLTVADEDAATCL